MRDRAIVLDIKEIRDIYHGQALRHPWETVRFEFVCSHIDTIIKKKRIDGLKVLDFGAGDAFIGRELAARYKESRIVCIDSAFDDSLTNALSELSSDKDISFYSDLKALKDTGFRANVVLMLDVLEHMENEMEALGRILESGFIDDNAVFIITAPAFQSLFSSHDEMLHHFRRYRLGRLGEIAKRADLREMAGGYIFLSLLLVRFFQVLLERTGLRQPVTGSALSSWQGGRIVTRLVETILQLDINISRLFNRLKVPYAGLTAFMICEKQ